MGYRVIFGACALAVGCAHFDTSDEPDLPLGAGYRDAADQCRIVGENDFTNQFLDDSSTLVGCPENYEGLGVFVTETGAIQVVETEGYILFTVPDV